MAAYQRRMEHLLTHLLRLRILRLRITCSLTYSYSRYYTMDSHDPPQRVSEASQRPVNSSAISPVVLRLHNRSVCSCLRHFTIRRFVSSESLAYSSSDVWRRL